LKNQPLSEHHFSIIVCHYETQIDKKKQT